MAIQPSVGGALERRQETSSLADVVGTILDKGVVIDVFARVSLVGIELLTVDARIVVASVDTYLRFAEATNRLDLQAASNSEGLPQLIGDLPGRGAAGNPRGALCGVAEEASGWCGGGDEEEEGPRHNGDRRP